MLCYFFVFCFQQKQGNKEGNKRDKRNKDFERKRKINVVVKVYLIPIIRIYDFGTKLINGHKCLNAKIYIVTFKI